MKKYIPVLSHWKDMFRKYPSFEVAEKISVESIKINRKLFSFDNPVNLKEVQYMVENFEISAWIPMTVNEKFYLLDGQHRLECAKRLGLKYIDVVIQKEGELKPPYD